MGFGMVDGVLCVDYAPFTVLRDLLVNGEVKDTMDARDICERECHPLSDGTCMSEGDRLRVLSSPVHFPASRGLT